MTVDFTFLTVFKKCRQKLANFIAQNYKKFDFILQFLMTETLKVYVNDVK